MECARGGLALCIAAVLKKRKYKTCNNAIKKFKKRYMVLKGVINKNKMLKKANKNGRWRSVCAECAWRNGALYYGGFKITKIKHLKKH